MINHSGHFTIALRCAIKSGMPIYEYPCKKCGKTIEVIQKFSDPVLRKHQGCGGSLTKLISQSAFQLKGTGWYVTDYARKGKAESRTSPESSKSPRTRRRSLRQNRDRVRSSKEPSKSSGIVKGIQEDHRDRKPVSKKSVSSPSNLATGNLSKRNAR